MDLEKKDDNQKETIYEDEYYTTSNDNNSNTPNNTNGSFSQDIDLKRMEELSSQSTMLHEADDSLNNSTSSYEIISLVLGIISIVSCCCCSGLNIVFGIVGIVFASLAKKEKGKNKQTGIGKAGEVCSIVGTVLAAVMLVYMISQIIIAGGIEEFYKQQEEILKDGYDIDLVFKIKLLISNIKF